MCITPIQLKKDTREAALKRDNFHTLEVPCGRCIECLKQRVNSWYVRLMAERKVSESGYFITLTYDNQFLPYTDDGEITLNYRDIQLFFKRLRKLQSAKYPNAKKIRYFAVGEYGTIGDRPHYHMLLFNVVDIEDVEKAWKNGLIHVGELNDKTTFYTLKYALKYGRKWKKSEYENTRVIEKALMSKGLGFEFLTDGIKKFYKEDVTRPIIMLGNKKLPLPRYYRDKLFTETEKSVRALKIQKKFSDERFEKLSSPLFPQRVEKMYSDEAKKRKNEKY